MKNKTNNHIYLKDFPFPGELVNSKLNEFLGITKDQLINKRPLSELKIKRMKFFYKEFVVHKRGFATKTKKFGICLCSTHLAGEYNISAETAMTWLKSLVKIGFLEVKNSNWTRGHFSKKYCVKDGPLMDLMNQINGFTSKYKKPESHKSQKSFREDAWNYISVNTIDRDDLAMLAQRYLGSPKAFIVDLLNRVPKAILFSPCEYDVRTTRFKNALSIFNFVQKKNGYKRYTFREFSSMIPYRYRYHFHRTMQYKAWRKDGHKIALKVVDRSLKRIRKAGITPKTAKIIKKLNNFKLFINSFFEVVKNPKLRSTDTYPTMKMKTKKDLSVFKRYKILEIDTKLSETRLDPRDSKVNRMVHALLYKYSDQYSKESRDQQRYREVFGRIGSQVFLPI